MSLKSFTAISTAAPFCETPRKTLTWYVRFSVQHNFSIQVTVTLVLEKKIMYSRVVDWGWAAKKMKYYYPVRTEATLQYVL